MIGVIYGGQSFEHEVSIKSGKDVLDCIDAVDLYIDKEGNWHKNGMQCGIENCLKGIDIAIIMVHGAAGENGTIQGLLEFFGVSYCGSGVKSSAICMDKDLTKKVLEAGGIKTSPSTTLYSMKDAHSFDFSFPCIIKASDLGSSVGVYKVQDYPLEYVKKCFTLSSKVLVEKYIQGREFYCSVLQDGDNVIVSSPCEIIHGDNIFSYEGKYFPDSSVQYDLSPQGIDNIKAKEIAKEVFALLECEGFARIDMFSLDNGDIIVNEVNSIPGFTKKSLFPKALIHEGLSYAEIIEKLINAARKPKRLQYGFTNAAFSQEGMFVN